MQNSQIIVRIIFVYVYIKFKNSSFTKNPQRKEKLRKCKYNKKETNFNDVIANNY